MSVVPDNPLDRAKKAAGEVGRLNDRIHGRVPGTPSEPRSPEELFAWAETYGDPEDWAKRAQDAHARAEGLEAELEVALQERDEAVREYAEHQSWRCEHAPHFYLADKDAAKKIMDADDCYCGLTAFKRRVLGEATVEHPGP